MGAALPYNTYVFDLDGTLTESEPGIVKSVQYALGEMGVTGYAREDLRFVVGPPLLHSFHDVIGMTEEDAYRAIRLYQKRYAVKGYLENSVYPGIPALLRSLREHGATLCIATAKPLDFAQKVLDAFGLLKYFERIAAPCDEDESQFKERLIRRALPENPGRAVMVGDRNLDMMAARACGMPGIGVLYGYGSREELTASGATWIVQDVDELAKMLLGGAPVSKGRFISLEGPDGSGKSTQARLIEAWLKTCGHAVVPTREPGGCRISERIRGIVLDAREEGMCDVCEALLFAAARAQHVSEVIVPALARGKMVLCDRFVDSSIAYQGAARGLGVEAVARINAPAVGDCMPDVTILMDIDPELSMSRRVAAEAPDRIERAKSDLPGRVYRAYLQMAEREPERFVRIDATGTPDEVFDRIKAALNRVL